MARERQRHKTAAIRIRRKHVKSLCHAEACVVGELWFGFRLRDGVRQGKLSFHILF